MHDRTAEFAPLVLRIGLGLVMLWFGYQQLMYPESWLGWVPDWISLLRLTPEMVVLLNGLFEVSAGVLLILGVCTRVVSFLLFAHLVLIIAEIGFTAIGMRDVAIAFAFFALALMGSGPYALRRKSIPLPLVQ